MTTPDIPLLDIAAWRDGGESQRARLAARMDQALRQSGFLLIENHGVPAGLRGSHPRGGEPVLRPSGRAEEPVRHPGRRARLDPAGRRGERLLRRGRRPGPRGHEGEHHQRPGLPDRRRRTIDAAWFTPNVWPDECPDLAALAGEFTGQVRELYYDLLRMSAVALGLADDFFVAHVRRGPHTFNINRYPPLSLTGPAKEGQYRVAPHTDWGILTILDRQPGYGGLQVQAIDGSWADAPYVPDAFTVNVADLLSRWTGERWRSTRHRVLPPPDQAPEEELISLIVFLEAEVDTVIKPVAGNRELAPVVAGEWLALREPPPRSRPRVSPSTGPAGETRRPRTVPDHRFSSFLAARRG